MRTSHLITCAILVAGVALLGCSRKVVVAGGGGPDVVVVQQERSGPPDHAPAHGYRKKHAGDNVVLVYDSRLQVYVVEGHGDCYYSAGQYFRLGVSAWEWSVDIGGPWRVVKAESDVPPGLRKMDVSAKNKKKAKNDNKGKGKKK